MEENKQFYARIPNYFFYDNGEFLNKIGGRDSFVLYCLIVSRKNMAEKTYISIREIFNVLKLNNNITKSRKSIIDFLLLQRENGLIDFDVDIETIGNDFFICIDWVDLFKKDVGWAPFNANDFDLHSKIGNIPYCIMWVLRMYTNHESNTSFISINSICSLLRCDIIRVQNSISLFEYSKLFSVSRTGLYYSVNYGRNVQGNNEYTYTGETSNLLQLSGEEVKEIMNKSVNIKENKNNDT